MISSNIAWKHRLSIYDDIMLRSSLTSSFSIIHPHWDWYNYPMLMMSLIFSKCSRNHSARYAYTHHTHIPHVCVGIIFAWHSAPTRRKIHTSKKRCSMSMSIPNVNVSLPWMVNSMVFAGGSTLNAAVCASRHQKLFLFIRPPHVRSHLLCSLSFCSDSGEMLVCHMR